MTMRQRGATRRYAKVATALLAATLVISGCGGSDVTAAGEAQQAGIDSQGVGTVVSDPNTAAVPGAPDTTAGAATAGGGTGTAGTAPAGSGTAPGPSSAQTGKDAPAQQGAAGTKSSGTAATDLAGKIEALVRTNPIFGGSGTCVPATLSEVRLGNLSTRSGVLGELFSPVVPALETFVAAQNACGGLNGHKIKLIFRDDQGDPTTAFSVGKGMIEQDKILAFVGNIQLLTIFAMEPLVKQTGVPIIGGDLTSDAWFSNPLLFPQGSSVQSFGFGYLTGITKHFNKKIAGNIWCIEVPRSCTALKVALDELAPKFGVTVARSPQVSITQPSYVQQCLEMKNAGVEALVLTIDAASAVRLARSCTQVGWQPETLIHTIGIGNEKQFFGNSWLGGTYIPTNVFPHIADNTPATRYYQASVRKFNHVFATGGAASSGWAAGALLVAASVNLPAQNPTTQDFLTALNAFKGQKWTRLGGLSASPLTFEQGKIPKIPYCLYNLVTNEANNGWASYSTTPVCSDLVAPSDPQNRR